MYFINWKEKVNENREEIERVVKKVYEEGCKQGEKNNNTTVYLWYDNSITCDNCGGNMASIHFLSIVIYEFKYSPEKRVENFCFDREMEETYERLEELFQRHKGFKKKIRAKKSSYKYADEQRSFWKVFDDGDDYWYLRFTNGLDTCYSLDMAGVSISVLIRSCDTVSDDKLNLALKWINKANKNNGIKLKRGCSYAELMHYMAVRLVEDALFFMHEEEMKEARKNTVANYFHYH